MTAAAITAHNGRLALIFPGQGSQYPGMASELVRESSTARRIIERADDVLGYALSRIMLSKQGEELDRTVHTQPAVFVHSMALLEVLREQCALSPIIAAGHSLGEYSALCAAGVMTFDTALEVIRVRAEGMDAAQPPGTCGMAALIGPERDAAHQVLAEQRGNDVLEAANYNAPDQVVVSGHLAAVKRFIAAAKELKRARTVLLPVSSAFHTELMEPARRSLGEKLDRIALKEPRFPVAANVNGKPHPFPDGAKELLINQVVRPVLWEDCVRTMQQAGAELFVEVGPGKVLTGLIRRIDRKARTVNLSSLRDVTSFAEETS
jgi:[acyl-carrier-protein] S-malonyltransferase